jgi:hypothetical protein
MSGNVTLLGGGQQQDRSERPDRQAQRAETMQRMRAQSAPPASEVEDDIPF